MIPKASLVGTTRGHLAISALARTQGEAPPESPAEPLLDIAEIQGNSLVGFNKDHQAFLYFRVTEPTAARRWLHELAAKVATVEETLAFRRLFRAMRARRQVESQGLKSTWLNIAFTFEGLKKLVQDQASLDNIPGFAFSLGMAARAGARLGDRTDNKSEPVGWVVGDKSNYPDFVLIIASDSPSDLKDGIRRVKREIRQLQGIPPSRVNRRGLQIIFEDFGATLPAPFKGHEHFGFRDGVSQPGVRGRVGPGATEFLTPRLLAPDSALALSHAAPGQPLVWPGQFVFGANYPFQDQNDPLKPGPTLDPDPAWLRNGSFLVIRRLRQDVAAFWNFISETAAQLSTNGAAPGITVDRLAAMLVGRWQNGTPVVRSPDDPADSVAVSALEVNHFNFAQPAPALTTITGARIPQVPGDGEAKSCPFGGHIRKVNPRDEDTELGGSSRTLQKRILRRGIPYGPLIKDRLRDDGVDRGLIFVSYQTSIEDQFEFLCHDWTNSSEDPHSFGNAQGQAAGQDVVIGQSATGDRSRSITLRFGERLVTLAVPREWVTATGGGYFFSPSISTLRDVLGEPRGNGPSK
jgi:Dyp-type peroxidase family